MGDDHLVLLLFLRLLARVSSAKLGELVLPGTVHVFAENSAPFGVGKADWTFLEFLFIPTLVLKEIENECFRARPDSGQERPAIEWVKVVQEGDQAGGCESEQNGRDSLASLRAEQYPPHYDVGPQC